MIRDVSSISCEALGSDASVAVTGAGVAAAGVAGDVAVGNLPGVQSAAAMQTPSATLVGPRAYFPPSRLTEVEGQFGRGARTSVAVASVLEAQREGESVAWIESRDQAGGIFPPDLAEAGVDLEALAIVHVPARADALYRAAELLLRSGAFGLVIIDTMAVKVSRGAAAGRRALSRLHAQAREHQSSVMLLSEGAVATQGDSLGPMVGLRYAPQRRPSMTGVWIDAQKRRDKVGVELLPLRFARPADNEERNFAASAPVDVAEPNAVGSIAAGSIAAESIVAEPIARSAPTVPRQESFDVCA